MGPDGNRRYRTTAFDYKTDRETQSKEWIASDTDILVFEGVFLFRPELDPYWDLKVFVEIDFQTSIHRALERDTDLFDDRKKILKTYRERYVPGQQIYLESARPETKADIVIDNNDFTRPIITYRLKVD